ncbi:MAG: phage Gp37/Gp68 family protein [Planctomycetes bacterium]|nr:phage Gp37/Gp68 family protein [Planctomycetota bacterium]
MSKKSEIEWTNSTWNPVTGCTKVSLGCKNCYAEKFAERWRGIPGHHYEQGFDLRVWPERLKVPRSWKKPRTIFVNSMSDLFHEKVPFSFIEKVFCAMEESPLHTFQVLTKRADRLFSLSGKLNWPSNVWIGVSLETSQYLWRVEYLRQVPAVVKFLSIEPFLGRIGAIDLTGIDWVIVGGESGPGARPIDPAWVREMRDQCITQGVSFFFKQWGGTQKKKTGRLLDGRTWDAMPRGHQINV